MQKRQKQPREIRSLSVACLCLSPTQRPIRLFSKELDSTQQLAQQREAVSCRGMCGGNWGLGTTCPEMGGPVSARASPPTLSDKTSCVLAVSIFSWNWKERKFGGQATSPGCLCQHPLHVVRGHRRSPKYQSLREVAYCSLPPVNPDTKAWWSLESGDKL